MIGNPPYGVKVTNSKLQYDKFDKLNLEFPADSAQLMMNLAYNILSSTGLNGFIIPKSFTYVSNWKNIRSLLFEGLDTLIDCKKVWDDVKLEQVIYIYKKNTSQNYKSGFRTNNILVLNMIIDKKLYKKFDILICGLDYDELKIGKKIHSRSQMLSKYVLNTRGGALQKKLKNNGKHKVLGGAQIQRYYITDGVKGYLNNKNIDTKSAYVKEKSILVQEIISHIDNPTGHLKITAAIPSIRDFVILNTISQLTIREINPYYVLGLLNSKIINWYVYRFIFAKAVRTMHFVNSTSDKIPIIIKRENEIVKLVEKLIKLSNMKNKNKQNILNLEQNMNNIFYDIFELTPSERKVIDASVPN